ncbi:8-oxo-dGTP diphosphatase [Thermofilum pendens]|uniref:Oxidized purine nucleoside triphosphate hydrolase n=1 Tax=Thermofilum pendens (strain DSM 2475 / Hrk 5) TaxID=368408 RepID=A1RZ11_THEPD|nr:8-oxo-dGTP diphosphatase [Thermofilum pendens]ABL78441.1 NUDIX hydrolase [Thermofilum pendens Hrk 5]
MWIATLCYLLRGDEVLLIRKLRGFGAGKYNGVGGKVEEGEDIWRAAMREVLEETGVEVKGLSYRGLLEFYAGGEEPEIIVHVFVSRDFAGEARPSDEAVPTWFKVGEIPYDEMWEDDRVWLPRVLEGRCVYGRFWFSGGFEKMLRYELSVYDGC